MMENQISGLARTLENIETPNEVDARVEYYKAQIQRFIDYITPLSRFQLDIEYGERPIIQYSLDLLQRVAHCYRTNQELMNIVSRAYDVYHSKFGIRRVGYKKADVANLCR